jgi:hypothetical protein
MLLQYVFPRSFLNERMINPRNDGAQAEGRVSAQQPKSLPVFVKHILQLLLPTSLKTFFDAYSKPSMYINNEKRISNWLLLFSRMRMSTCLNEICFLRIN